MSCEVSWFSALCDDDYEFLGVPDGRLQSSWEHCQHHSPRGGAGRIRQPAAALRLRHGNRLDRIRGRDRAAAEADAATGSRADGRDVGRRSSRDSSRPSIRCSTAVSRINIISSEHSPGQALESGLRYRRTLEFMRVLRDILNGAHVDLHGEFFDASLDPPRMRPARGGCPPFYFGGLSEAAREGCGAGSRRLPDVARHDKRSQGHP